MRLTILCGWLFAEKRILHQPSLESVRKLWEDWEVQILVVFSLLLQMSLIVLGNRRKYNPGTWPRLPIWSAYLMADWVATVALGVLFKRQRNSGSCTADKTNPIDDELMAFWAPFLLLHLGGPDTITAYAIADNELWIRHLLGLGVQTGVALYITYTAWSVTRISFLTIPMLFAGFIKYGERSLALMSANREHFLDSLLDSPDPGPSYAKFMEEFSLKMDEGFCVLADEVIEVYQQSDVQNEGNKSAAAAPLEEVSLSHQSNIVQKDGNNSAARTSAESLEAAYKFFQTFKRLFVDLILSFQDRDKSQAYFQKAIWEDAFKLVEIELGFAYDAFYTKAPILYTRWGCIFRFITSSITIIVFVLFLFVEKHNHLRTNLIISYILLAGAIILDFYGAILLLLSDRAKLWLSMHKSHFCCFQPMVISKIISCFKAMVSRITSCFQHVVSPVTHFFEPMVSPVTYFFQPMVSRIISCVGNIVSSFLPSNKKRWSNSLAQYNLLRFSVKRNLVPFRDNKRVQKFVKKFPFLETLEKYLNEDRCKISREMKEVIFQHFLKKSKGPKEKPDVKEEKVVEANKAKTENNRYIASLCSARGGLVFKEEKYECSSSFDWSTEQVEFDQSILIWHVATDLCYHENSGQNFADKDSSKKLSDYMLYLLVMRPSMLPIGIGMIRFRDTCEEIKEFSKEKGFSSKDMVKLRTMLCKVSTEVEPTKVKGDRSKSVLFDGCRLARLLQEMGEKLGDIEKWEFVCNVWIEIMGYAASHCRGYYHAQQLAKGGELLTHVWLLMAHLGITEQFQINRGHARAKLAVK